MRLLISILILFNGLNLLAQESLDKDYIGLYGECKESYFVCKQIEIKPDSTFTYAQFYDVGGWHSVTGNWSLKDNGRIVLNTFNKYEYAANSTVEKIIENQNFTTIRIQMIDRPIGKAAIKINNDSTYLLGDLFGEVSLPFIGVKTISIKKVYEWSDMGLEQYDFYISDSLSNDITVIVKPHNIYNLMDYFVDYEIKVWDKKLYYWHKRNGNFDKKSYLKKTNIENKEFE